MILREERIFCDCCAKEMTDYIKLRLPIKDKHYGEEGIPVVKIRSYDMDICEKCANKILKFYYNLAEENGHSGIIAVTEDGET